MYNENGYPKNNNNEENALDSLFKNKLQNFEVSPPNEIWSKIKQKMPPVQPKAAPFYHQQHYFIWYSIAVSMIMLLGGMSIGAYIHSKLQLSQQLNNPNLTTLQTHQNNTVIVDENKPLPNKNLSLTQNNLNTIDLNTYTYNNSNKVNSYTNTLKNNYTVAHKNSAATLQATVHLPTSNLISSTTNKLNFSAFNILPNISKNDAVNSSQNNEGYFYENKDDSYNTQSTNYSLNNKKLILNAQELEPINKISFNNQLNINATPLILPPVKAAAPAIELPKQSNILTTGLYFETFSSVNNTWILNKKAIQQTASSDLSYAIDFGNDYGVGVGYDFLNNFGIEVNWIINSFQGQKYNNFLTDAHRSTVADINLTYSYLPVLLKYRTQHLSRLSNQPATINYMFGFEYGWLKSAEINIDNRYIHEDLLQKHTFGVLLGIDYNLHLTPNYFVSIGGRTGLSTQTGNNLFAVPGTQRTNNLLIGIRAGLGYRFK